MRLRWVHAPRTTAKSTGNGTRLGTRQIAVLKWIDALTEPTRSWKGCGHPPSVLDSLVRRGLVGMAGHGGLALTEDGRRALEGQSC